MKKLVVRLSLLGILASAYIVGLNAASQVVHPRFIVYCCTSGDDHEQCCSVRGCTADGTSCRNF